MPPSAVSLWQWKVLVPAFQEFWKHAAGNACFQSLNCYSRKDGLMACSFTFARYPAHVSFLLNRISSSSQQLLLSRVLRAVEPGWNESRAFLGQLWGLSDSWLPTCRSLSWMFAIIWPSARVFLVFCFFFFSKQKEQVMLKDYFPVSSSNELPQEVPSSKQKRVGWRKGSCYCWLWCICLIHQSPECTKELHIGFSCPRDVNHGHRWMNDYV